MNEKKSGKSDGIYFVSFAEMLKCFSDALDLLNLSLRNHHRNTAFIAQRIALEMGLNKGDVFNITAAAAVHDIGACVLDDRSLSFDYDPVELDRHSIAGYQFLYEMQLFEKIADIIRFHHCRWNYGEGTRKNGRDVPLGSHIVHLADRIDILIEKGTYILEQADDIKYIINENSCRMFHPDVVSVFNSIAAKKSFWMDVDSESQWDKIFYNLGPAASRSWGLYAYEITDYVKLLVRLIDFKSRFTAAHSTGVAAVAEAMSIAAGFQNDKIEKIRFAGYLHDIGKLSIPAEILEKPDKLTEGEFRLMISHPYHTLSVLNNLDCFSEVKIWASQHHENICGLGYPFSHSGDEISEESRIISLADVFTALSENRPYRRGLDTDSAIKIIYEMSSKGLLDGELVLLLSDNLDSIDDIRRENQEEAIREYSKWSDSLNMLINYQQL